MIGELIPKVVQAVAGKDYTVYAYFNDGTIHLFDAKPLLTDNKDSVFYPLSDKTVFKNTLTVLNDTVAWDITGKRDVYKCVDIDPYVVYESPEVEDPRGIADE